MSWKKRHPGLHSAVYEKADVESMPPDTAAYKVVEDIRDYSRLGGLKKERYRLQQQIYMFNMLMANQQQALMSHQIAEHGYK